MVPSVAFIQSLLKKGNGGRRIVHWKNALVQTRSGQAFRPDNATRGPFEMRLLEQSVEQQNGDMIDQSHGQPRPGARNQRETVGLEITDRVDGVPHVVIGPRRARPFPVVFFFQAEDGIRDYKVTGVQTCALPISLLLSLMILIKFL